MGECNRYPDAKVCACDPPCDAICVVEGCDKAAAQLMPCELIFGSVEGSLLKTDWGSGQYDEFLSKGGWDTWVCEDHGV